MEQKPNTGTIFKNDKKTADNQPDYRGKINVEGKELEISLWVKTAQSGVKYMSAAIKEPWVAPAPAPAPAPVLQNTSEKIKSAADELFEDDLPF
jgi:uncharacterized protein (DUF736 family)